MQYKNHILPPQCHNEDRFNSYIILLNFYFRIYRYTQRGCKKVTNKSLSAYLKETFFGEDREGLRQRQIYESLTATTNILLKLKFPVGQPHVLLRKTMRCDKHVFLSLTSLNL